MGNEEYKAVTETEATEALSQLVNQPLIDILVSEGISVNLYFGEIESYSPVLSTWRLWVEGMWRVSSQGIAFCSVLNTTEEIVAALRRLIGSKVEGVSLAQRTCDLILRFSDGFEFAVFTGDWRDDQWTLRNTNGVRLVCAESGLREFISESDAKYLKRRGKIS